MRTDVADLKSFYDTPLGQAAVRQIARKLAEFWPEMSGETVVGLGYAAPLLEAVLAEAKPDRAIALMPAEQGAWGWPDSEPSLTALTAERQLPLADRSADRIVMLHALEDAAELRPLLREVWRVLADSGRLIVIAANRRGLWHQAETKPFGHGRPYSRAQLRRVLKASLFVVEQEAHALYFPPSRRALGYWSADYLERIGGRWFGRFGGVVIADASKSLYGAAPTASGARAARAANGVVEAPADMRERD